jgi:hypothetical protein
MMDYKGMNIVARIPAYCNRMMLEQCKILYKIVTQTKEVKVRSGRNYITNHVLKHRTPPEVVEKLKNSITYYQNLHNHEMNNQIELRDYQKNIVSRATEIIGLHGFVYLAMEVRTGKTLTSLSICDNLPNVEHVLFLTKKKAIDSITADSDKLCPSYALFVMNYESIHKLPKVKWDVIVCDEAHSMGAFPKPSLRAMQVRDLIRENGSRVILLSGTPTPESYSQMYHQICGIPNNPFKKYSNFYRFADDYVKKTQKKINGVLINDYSHAYPTVLDAMVPYTIRWSQQESGFVVKTTEEILRVQLEDKTLGIIKKLQKDLVIEGKGETILADTPVKLMSKLHQLYSGTVKFESGNSMVLDLSKAKFIKERFKYKKIGIFYKFKEELNALQQVFGDDLTTELSVFEDTNKHIALQIVSGREGISLKKADCLVYYNIDFSATSYWQSRDRMTTKDRLENKIYWVFAHDGIEDLIYKAVSKKKDYTVSHFKRDLLVL